MWAHDLYYRSRRAYLTVTLDCVVGRILLRYFEGVRGPNWVLAATSGAACAYHEGGPDSDPFCQRHKSIIK